MEHTRLHITLTDTSPLSLDLRNKHDLDVVSANVGNYNTLVNKPKINGVTLIGNKTSEELGLNLVHIGTTEYWNEHRDLIALNGHLYIYSDYRVYEEQGIPGMKVGDGTTYLIDIPFIDGNELALRRHIEDTHVHITDAEREFWNNKVTSYISEADGENLILTKE